MFKIILSYKESISFFRYEYTNIRDTEYVIDYLQPETNYQFEVMVVLGQGVQSEYSTVLAFTRDPSKHTLLIWICGYCNCVLKS